MTSCPRCTFETVDTLHSSPVPGVWDVLQCGRCLYTWRTTEPARRTQRDAYPEGFRLTAEDIANAPEVPTVPPLLNEIQHSQPVLRSRAAAPSLPHPAE